MKTSAAKTFGISLAGGMALGLALRIPSVGASECADPNATELEFESSSLPADESAFWEEQFPRKSSGGFVGFITIPSLGGKDYIWVIEGNAAE